MYQNEYFTNSEDDGAEKVKFQHLFDVRDKRIWGVVERVDVHTEGGAGYHIHTVGPKNLQNHTNTSNMTFIIADLEEMNLRFFWCI